MTNIVKYKWALYLLLLIPVLSGCNNADDVQKIFTGKTWKMTYITRGKGESWYKFPGVDETVYKSYDPATGSRSFRLTFTGSTSEDMINGDFIGNGSVSIKGTWSANGESNQFATIIKSSSVTDSKDTLGKFIIEGLKKANSYEGDENNLYLYFEYENETLWLAFKPDR